MWRFLLITVALTDLGVKSVISKAWPYFWRPLSVKILQIPNVLLLLLLVLT